MNTLTIKTYAHDYRDMKMSEEELRIMLIDFVQEYEEEVISAEKTRRKELGSADNENINN